MLGLASSGRNQVAYPTSVGDGPKRPSQQTQFAHRLSL
jgi:hypothetical protein